MYMLCICIYIHIYVCMHIYICACVCVCVCVCACVCLCEHCYIYYASPAEFLRFEHFMSFLRPRSFYVYMLRGEVNSHFFKVLYKKRE